MSHEWSWVRSARLIGGVLLVSLSSASCGEEGDTIVIYANGGGAGQAPAGGGPSTASGGGSAHAGGGSLSSGGEDGTESAGGAGANSGSGSGAGGSTGSSGGGSATGGEGGKNGGGLGGSTNPSGALFVEDFEDGDLEGWRLETSQATHTVTTATAANGSTRSLAIVGGDEAFEGAHIPLGGLKPSKLTWWVRIESFDQDPSSDFVVSTHPDVDTVRVLFSSGLSDGGVDIAGFHSDTDPSAGQWYQCEVRFDWTLGIYEVLFEGHSLGAAEFDLELHTALFRIDLYNATLYPEDYVSHYDEIVMLP